MDLHCVARKRLHEVRAKRGDAVYTTDERELLLCVGDDGELVSLASFFQRLPIGPRGLQGVKGEKGDSSVGASR